MFADSQARIKAEPTNVEAGIQAIVFGTFLLEAICNDSYRQFLSAGIPDAKLADAVWRATKRLSILEKVDIASAVGAIDGSKLNEYVKKLKALFDLRNRLAHFKDDDAPWNVPVDFIVKPENWPQAPDPELMSHLTGQEVIEYAIDVEDLLAWFDQVFRIKRTPVAALALSPDESQS